MRLAAKCKGQDGTLDVRRGGVEGDIGIDAVALYLPSPLLTKEGKHALMRYR